MDFNENLRAIRIERGITQKSLGQSIGVTPVTIGNWERGVREPSFGLLVKLADILRTSTDELLGRPPVIGESIIQKYMALDSHGRKLVDTICTMEYERINHDTKIIKLPKFDDEQHISKNRYIPRYMSPPAAGSGTPLEGDDFEMIRVDDSVPDDADYAVYVSGDSMEPYIHDGDMVFVKEVADLNDGDIGIFSVNGSMYCKQYHMDDDRNLHLLSANPYREDVSIHISHDSEDSVYCCGKVLLPFNIPLPDDI